MTHLSSRSSISCLIVLLAGLAFAIFGYSVDFGRTEMAGIIGATILVLAGLDASVGVLACFFYLALMGDLRRILPPAAGSLDPMLLIGPAVVVFVLLRLIMTGELRFDTPLSKLVAVVICLMVVQVFNPIQGGLMVGFAGTVFYVVPLLWYLVGKSLARHGLARRLVWTCLIPIATAGLALGMFQTFVGFLSFEARWIRSSGYSALGIGEGKIRPFGFYVSASEYALFLSMAAVPLIAMLMVRRLRWSILLLPFLLIGLFLEGSRQFVVLLVAAACAMWGALAPNRVRAVVRMGMAAAVMVGVLVAGLNQLEDVDLPASIRPHIQHQVEGLLDPGHSTATSHAYLFQTGIITGIKNPLGKGIGDTTMASKSGDGTEMDLSDIFVCLGLGGLLYAAVIVMGLRSAVIHFTQARTVSALATVGILTATLGFWIMGSAYAAAPLICLLLGTTDPGPPDEAMLLPVVGRLAAIGPAPRESETETGALHSPAGLNC